MQAKMWQKDEKLRQLKEIVQVCPFSLESGEDASLACSSFHSLPYRQNFLVVFPCPMELDPRFLWDWMIDPSQPPCF